MEAQLEELCAELSGLGDETSRRAFVDRYPQLLQPEIVKQLAEAVRQQVRVDVPKAAGLAEAAVTIAAELNDNEAVARALRAKANALWFMGECKSAVDLFEQAAFLFEEAQNMNEVGRTLSTSLQSLILLGEYERAFAAADKARQIFTRLGATWRLARLELNVANIHHRQNRFTEALAAYQLAYERLLPHKDMEAIGGALHNMAVCLIVLDDFRGALEAYQRARDVCHQNEMPLLVAQADYNIAYLFYLRGDYSHALELLRAARESCRKNGDSYHQALCDLDQSEIYLELGLIEEAARMAQKSLEQFQKLSMGYEAARSLANLAIAVSQQGQPSRALELFSNAKNMFAREGNKVWPSVLNLYQAVILLEEGDLAEARGLCVGALNLFGSLPMPSKQVLCHLILARLSLRAGDLDGAGRSCKDALQLLAQLEAPVLHYQAHFLMGLVQEGLGEAQKALDDFEAARLALETLRSSLQADELKIGFIKNKLELYAHLVQLCLERKSGPAWEEQALAYMEDAKARGLRDLIVGRAQPQLTGAVEETEISQRIRDLRNELNWYYHRIEGEELNQAGVPQEHLEGLRLQARTREHELLRVWREQPSSGPEGTALRNSAKVPVDEIRAALDSETALVEYFCIGERILAILLTRKTLKIVPLTVVPRVLDAIRMLPFQLSKFRLGEDYVKRFQEPLLRATRAHLRRLYEDVFAPLRRLLKVAHLVIVPHGPLHSLPFHALFDGRRYLIDRFSISYAPSASIYALCTRQPECRSGSSLIMGVDDSKTPFIAHEVQSVAAVVPDPEILVGSNATEAALREKGPHCRLIHIATHGYFRQDNPMFSGIRMSGSYLSLFDLYYMNLPVELLTLSGCVTGLNVVADGDELLGLARGLLYAGAQSLLLSHWDVSDRSTAEFMKVFYTRMLNQRNKAQALQSAMLELRAQYPHPYYWAPFKLIGKALCT